MRFNPFHDLKGLFSSGAAAKAADHQYPYAKAAAEAADAKAKATGSDEDVQNAFYSHLQAKSIAQDSKSFKGEADAHEAAVNHWGDVSHAKMMDAYSKMPPSTPKPYEGSSSSSDTGFFQPGWQSEPPYSMFHSDVLPDVKGSRTAQDRVPMGYVFDFSSIARSVNGAIPPDPSETGENGQNAHESKPDETGMDKNDHDKGEVNDPTVHAATGRSASEAEGDDVGDDGSRATALDALKANREMLREMLAEHFVRYSEDEPRDHGKWTTGQSDAEKASNEAVKATQKAGQSGSAEDHKDAALAHSKAAQEYSKAFSHGSVSSKDDAAQGRAHVKISDAHAQLALAAQLPTANDKAKGQIVAAANHATNKATAKDKSLEPTFTSHVNAAQAHHEAGYANAKAFAATGDDHHYNLAVSHEAMAHQYTMAAHDQPK